MCGEEKYGILYFIDRTEADAKKTDGCKKGWSAVNGEKIRFAVIGAGWRSQFYLSVARQMPERFEVTGVLLRSEEKAQRFAQQFGVKTFVQLDELLQTSPAFVVVSLPRTVTPQYLDLLMKAGVPVLCETPPAWLVEELTKLWNTARQYHAKIQVAEQYFARPMIAAQLKAVEMGLLGNVSFVEQSVCHGYHGINLIRRFLGTGFESCEVSARRFFIPVTKTCTRDGDIEPQQRTVEPVKRDLCVFSFAGGKTGIYDFSSEQYRSFIRHNRIQVLGDRGEIVDDQVYWLSASGVPASGELTRMDHGVRYDIDGFCNRSVMLGEYELYRNPFMPARLGDDEIAVAYCMENMGRYVLGEAEPVYPLQEVLQDTYLAICMGKALESGEKVQAEKQAWA